MTDSTPDFSHITTVSDRTSVFTDLKSRGRRSSNIWFFDSPKNGKRIKILGDVAFMHLVLAEGMLDVLRYDYDPVPIYTVIENQTRNTTLDVIAYLANGSCEWWKFERYQDAGRAAPQLDVQAQTAAHMGQRYRVMTEKDLAKKEVLFDNWLNLCAGISRCRGLSLHREESILIDELKNSDVVDFQRLYSNGAVDPACMFAVVASALQHGVIFTDLDTQLFGLNSLLAWRRT